MLVFQNNLPNFSESQKKIKDFFQEAFNRVAMAKGSLGVKRNWALEMLKFKEVQELYLGYTNYGSFGSGIGEDFARQIFDSIVDFIDLGLQEFGGYLGPFEIFVEKIGADRISDMIANIIKEDLINYTQKICKEKSVYMKDFNISNFKFDPKFGWIHKKVSLPENPINHRPIVLVPKDFLRATSWMNREDFLEYVLHMENDELRLQATRLFTQDLDKGKLRKIIQDEPQIFKQLLKEYIDSRKSEKALPYDIRNDPEMLYWFNDLLAKITKTLPKINLVEQSFESFLVFIEKVLDEFKKCVESNEGYKLLFNDDGTPRKEKAAQVFFSQVAITLSKQCGDVDCSSEYQTGRGPVDFKLSSGYNKRVIVELKLASSGSLYSGLEKQLPIYLESSDVGLGYYLVIKQLGGDNARVINLQDKYNKLPQSIKSKIKIFVIDSYIETKKSASKI